MTCKISANQNPKLKYKTAQKCDESTLKGIYIDNKNGKGNQNYPTVNTRKEKAKQKNAQNWCG
jgi:hypothetical protein